MKLLKYIFPALILGLLLAGGVHALSVSLPSSVKKGDLLIGSSTNSSLYTLSTSSQGSVLWIGSSGVPAWTATSTLGILGGGGGTWGSITGTLSSQTDLQNALNAKLSTTIAAGTYQPLGSYLTASSTIIAGGTATHSPSITFSTTTDTNILLSIVCATSTCTFNPSWTGTPADGRIASAATWNAKQAAISVTAPITLTGASVGVVNQGTTVTVLHGNASGNATFSAVALGSDVSGILPVLNGGTGSSTQIFVTSVTASGNLSSSGGLTPAITITATPTFTGLTTTNASTTNLTVATNTYFPSLSAGCLYTSGNLLYSTGVACGSGGGGITSLNGLSGASQTFATGTATGIGLNIVSSGTVHTFTPTVLTNYGIPLTASSTNWNNFWNTPSTQITAGNNLSWTGNTLSDVRASSTLTAGGVVTFSPNITFSTTTDTNLLLSIVCGTSTCTFNPAWTGTLADGRIASAANWNGVYNNVLSRLAIATGTAGSIFNIATSTNSLTLNLPYASTNNTGQLTSTDWNTFNGKQASGAYLTGVTADSPLSGAGTSGSHLVFTNPGYILGNQSISLTGDITGTGATAITTALKNTGSAGSCTNCNITFDAQGRETAQANGSGSGLASYNVVSANNLITVSTTTNLATLTASTSPYFTALTLGSPLAVAQGGTGLTSGYNNTNWDTAYSGRLQWDGGNTNLVAATGRTSLGLTDTATLASSTWAKIANNLSDLASTSTAWTNLGGGAIGKLAVPSSGIVTSNGSALSNITDSSANWNTAYGWGNYASAIGSTIQGYNASLAAIAGGTWTGAASITTLGTVTTGTWGATDITVLNGGTGASSLTANDVLFGAGTAVIGTSTTFTYNSTTNNLFVTNASTTNFTVGTAELNQGTLTVSGNTSLQNASSTALTVSGQTVLATTSVAGINILGTFDKSFSLASTSPDYIGLSFNTATFTIPSIWNPYTTSTLVSLFCKTDVGTLLLNFAGNLLSCTTAGASSAPNATLNSRADVKVMLGTAASSPTNISVTATFHY